MIITNKHAHSTINPYKINYNNYFNLLDWQKLKVKQYFRYHHKICTQGILCL